MSTSTETKLIAVALAIIAICIMPQFAAAARPRVAVAPCAHATPNVRSGLAAVFAEELAYGGHFDVVRPGQVSAALEQGGLAAAQGAMAELTAEQLAPLTGQAEYLLLVEVTAFTVTSKEAAFDLGRKLSELGQRTGLGGRVAQAGIRCRVLRISDAAELLAFSVEGLESRHGTPVDVTQGWLSSTDYRNDEFRRTCLGRAFYKALGQALYELYAEFPLQGSVLAVTGDAVIIDLDQRAGLQIGDEISITRDLPVTNALGETVWTEQQRVGAVRVVEFQPGKALCLILDGLGAILEHDTARPLNERLVLPLETEREEQP